MKKMLSTLVSLAATTLVLLAMFPVGTAQAGNGVAEINHTCAVETGCFTGDSSGYPVTITGAAGHSYILTSDLIVPDEDTSGIVVSSSSTGIDLNNFEIVRSGCEGATLSCIPTSGTGSGVSRSLTQNRGISVKNGSVTGMGSRGLYLGDQAEVSHVRARWNRLSGIQVGQASTVSDSSSYENGTAGITTSPGATVTNNNVSQNLSTGISASTGSKVAGNTVYGNDGTGIIAGSGSAVSDNAAFDNGQDGINASAGSTITRNSAYSNGDDGIFGSSGSLIANNSTYSNTSDGIVTASGVSVQRNSSRFNGEFGLRLGTGTAYRENVITNNTGGSVTGGVNMFSNSCNGTTTCP